MCCVVPFFAARPPHHTVHVISTKVYATGQWQKKKWTSQRDVSVQSPAIPLQPFLRGPRTRSEERKRDRTRVLDDSRSVDIPQTSAHFSFFSFFFFVIEPSSKPSPTNHGLSLLTRFFQTTLRTHFHNLLGFILPIHFFPCYNILHTRTYIYRAEHPLRNSTKT